MGANDKELARKSLDSLALSLGMTSGLKGAVHGFHAHR
jgi:hypothetical protein